MPFFNRFRRSQTPSPPPRRPLTFRERCLEMITGQEYHEWEESHRLQALATRSSLQSRQNSSLGRASTQQLPRSQSWSPGSLVAFDRLERPLPLRTRSEGIIVGRFDSVGIENGMTGKETRRLKNRRQKRKKSGCGLCCVLKCLFC
jgi:hypothetical protein